jgi:hypothetical protein
VLLCCAALCAVQYESKSHTLTPVRSSDGRIELTVVANPPVSALLAAQQKEFDSKQADVKAGGGGAAAAEGAPSNAPAPVAVDPQASIDFDLSYSMQSPEILPTLIVEEAPANAMVTGASAAASAAAAATAVTGGGKGTFTLFVTPPSLESLRVFFARNMIFLLDRSGSMTGEPFSEACRALVSALSVLRPTDQFTIVAFDHRMEFFTMGLVPATQQSIVAATQWIATIHPDKGSTSKTAHRHRHCRLCSPLCCRCSPLTSLIAM